MSNPTADQEGLAYAMELVADINNLRHMLGARLTDKKRDWGFRNYFNCGPTSSDYPSLERLLATGLVRRGHRDYYHATEAGCKVVGLNAKQTQRALHGD